MRRFLLSGAALALASCWLDGDLKERRTTVPEPLGDGWEIATPASVGLDAKILATLHDEILREDRFVGMTGLLVVKDGQLVWETYLGAVTKPWEANPVFQPLPPEAFAAYAQPDHVKIAWTLRADPRADGGTIFRTETRAVATDAGARRKFRRYWALFSPGIILIRSAMLAVLEGKADRDWRLEGDDLIADPRAQLTHATTIDALPEAVWPWLVQIGCQRAGWYSWDVLDNAGKRSADRVVPELQHLAVGDVIPAKPVGKDGFEVLRIVPERALVLGAAAPKWDGTWAFVLAPLASGRTRLITRYRAAYRPSVGMSMALPVIATVHAFMERKQLRTIKHHVERLAA